MFKVNEQIDLLKKNDFWDRIQNLNESDHDSQKNIYQTFYWLNSGKSIFSIDALIQTHLRAFFNVNLTDRYYWKSVDPINLSEGLYAIANVISIAQMCFYLPLSQQLGPLQITLGKMINVTYLS
jgi:hypothetical protein